MSDFNDERPFKRRRQHASPSPPPRDLDERHSREHRRSQDRSHDSSQRHERRQAERYNEQRSLSRGNSSESERYASPRRRDRSRNYSSHAESRSRRDRERSRSRSPRSDRYDDHRKKRGTDCRTRNSGTSFAQRDSEEYPSRSAHRSRNRSQSHEDRRHRKRDKERNEDRYRDRIRTENVGRRPPSTSPKPYQRQKGPLPSQQDAFSADADPNTALDKPIEKQKPNFGLTGKLAAASNTVKTANQSIVLKYHEPPEARKPSARDRWRLYIFKDEEILDTVELSEQSCWLFGREVAVVDVTIEHSSCSKQHAVIQFRYIEKRNEFGDKIGKVKPYVIDLESANGTTVNEDPIPPAKYVELIDKDVVRFGHSSREYVVQLPPSGK